MARTALLLILLSLQFFASQAFAMGVVGFWKGESFSLEVSGSRISGYWGNKTYDIQMYATGFEGKISGTDVRIDNWNPDITGKLPCGDVDIKAWSAEVEGVICGESFATTSGSQKDSDHVATETATSAFLNEFPVPSHGTLRNHIRWFRNDENKNSKNK